MWNDPKLSPVHGTPLDLDEERASSVKKSNPADIVIARAIGASKLRSPDSIPTSLPGHAPAPTLATLDQVLHEHANLRPGYLRRSVSLPSPPSPSDSSSDPMAERSEKEPTIC